MNKLIDHIGQRYGRLLVLQRANNANGNARWECVCDCGTITIVHGIDLGRNVNSCGCLRKEITGANFRTAGGRSKHPLYKTWINMHTRCYNPNTEYYKNYGGRGISVCAEWHNFWQFAADMKTRPNSRYSLERKDNEKGYSKENCKWALSKEQNNNMRRNITKRNAV